MDLDPKKLIEMGTEVADSIGLFKRVTALLPARKPPAQKARRKVDWDPERDADRRISGHELRLKTGIWLHFHRKTGLGKAQPMETLQRGNLIAAFVEEGVNYQFSEHSSDALLMPSAIANKAADFACARWKERPTQDSEAYLVVEEFADYILTHYNVRMIDRRRGRKARSMAS
jgi:hypothetical protein